jgi:anhydro-N-acetylmuramic acid kinase
MANLTRLPPVGGADAIVAFDTGPGNALIDAAVTLASDGAERFDDGGHWARRGGVDEPLLAELLDHPFLRRPPPKSTGREAFGQPYVRALVDRLRPADPGAWADLVATLTALTAHSIARAVRAWAPIGEDGEMVVTGGGARNGAMMAMLRDALAPVPVRTDDVLGFDARAKEAIAFAVLAWAHVTGRPANMPSVTGAAGVRILGSHTPG